MKAKKWTKPEIVLLVLTLLFLSGTAAAYGFRAAERQESGYTVQTEGAAAFVESLETALPENTAAPSDAGEAGAEKIDDAAAGAPAEPPKEVPEEARININTADAETLKKLPRIGDVLAERIIAYREAHGGFSVPTELMRVEGIGRKTYQDLADLVTVGENGT